ncbi:MULTISPECIES: class I SAM-dependent methyltransferase [Spirulina sp. CCY15215]|uniref:class I SAM-dependent methyltransferase n=1 Tax=Spirulina sp. CCY15215 TaxID=2767591 RepID=UPI0019524DD5|nr:class I SAM-dependent methyltransferase [Spirulina major]
MTAHYDRIAELYVKTQDLPYRPHIEEYTYWQIIEDIAGLSVLDLACGDGLYTRQFKEKGASRVVGVDISSKMIELAREQENERPLGIEYIVRDALKLGKIGEFDRVVSSYLLAYAQTRSQLLQMCLHIFLNLKPGGYFISINTNYQFPHQESSRLKKYGITFTLPTSIQEGEAIAFTLKTIGDGQDVEFDNYYFNRSTYEEVFREVGFSEIHWHQLIVSPEGIEVKGREFWQDFLDYPIFIGIKCLKSR